MLCGKVKHHKRKTKEGRTSIARATLIYTQLLNFNEEEWTCKATTDSKEATQLIENGFEYILTTPDSLMLFRKRK